MKNICLLTGLLSISFSVLAAECIRPQLQSHFEISNPLLSDMEIKAPQSPGAGSIESSSWGSKQNYFNRHHELIARGEFDEGMTSDTFTIYDCNNEKIGTIRANGSVGFLTGSFTYSVFAPNGSLLAVTEKIPVDHNSMKVFGPDGKTVFVQFEWNRRNHVWDADIQSGSNLDQRLVVMLKVLRVMEDEIQSAQD